MFSFIKIVGHAIQIAFQELSGNRLRTFLSMLGIAVGIFAMISVLSIVESLEGTIKSSFSRLGNDVVFVNKNSWNEDPNANRWKIKDRPDPSYREYEILSKQLKSAEAVCMRSIDLGIRLTAKGNYVENANIAAGTHEFAQLFDLTIEQGRYFTPEESQIGSNRIVLGATLAEELFPKVPDPSGKTIKMGGRKLLVTGIIKKEGSSLLGNGYDEIGFVPLNFMRNYRNVEAEEMMPLIAIKAAEGISLDQLEDEAKALLRAHRQLRPSEEDNFALNRLTILTSIIDGVFLVIYLAGLLISLFSTLVGAFGIANIMFVSVRERTRLIGIKKAMGAHNYHILWEFLVEAVVLTLLGGAMGVLMVILAIYLFNWYFPDFHAFISTSNLIIAVLVSVLVGVIAGLVPAIIASLMNPVEAIRK